MSTEREQNQTHNIAGQDKEENNPQSIAQYMDRWLAENQERVLSWRRHLHSNPELSHKEYLTTQFILETLREEGLEPQVILNTPGVTGTGVYVDIEPLGMTEEDKEQHPLIAFRGDIDALPVEEETALPYKSTQPGVMHACGHDIHTTVVLALSVVLAQARRAKILKSRVRCIFQPAEEVMDGGAIDVIAAGVLEGVSRIFAVHCEPKLRTGQVGVRVGAITSAADVFEIRLSGSGGHTSRPHLTTDLVNAAGLVVTQMPALLSRQVDPRSGTVLVFGSMSAGSTFNAIPQNARMLGTIRTGSLEVWRRGQDMVEALTQDIVRPTGAKAEVIYTKGVPPVHNDAYATEELANSVKSWNPQALVEAPQSTGGEDFSWYLQHVPGSMARLGCWDGRGQKPDLHQPDIIFDEGAIAVGARLFAGVVDQYQKD